MEKIDFEKFKKLFLQEADEQLEVMEKAVMELEENGENRKVIDEFFRMAHSLKGSAGSMGYSAIADLTHQMENVLDKLRNNPGSLNDDITDLLFISIDTLKHLRENVEKDIPEEENPDIQHILERFQDFISIETDGKKKANVEKKIQLTSQELKNLKEKAGENNVLLLCFELIQQQEMQSMMAFLVLNNLKDEGEIVKTFPHHLEEVEGDLPYFSILICTEKKEEDLVKLVEQTLDREEFKVFSLEDIEQGKASDYFQEIKENFSRRDESRDSIRVDIEKVDQLMKLVGELVIDKERLLEISKNIKANSRENSEAQALLQTIPHVDFIATELHESVMDIRMYPVGSIFKRFPRLVRDISKQTGKDIHLEFSGEDTELDRTILQEVFDPLVHLLRNAIDHGIEAPSQREKSGKPSRGTVALNAWQEENNIVIEVKDDGAGIDPEKIKTRALEKGLVTEAQLEEMDQESILELIMEPGFSTSETVNDLSGRGVGMDVVRTNIEKLDGEVEISSEKGNGTSIKIVLPLTLAIVQALMVREKGNDYAIPLSAIFETIAVNGQNYKEVIKTVKNREVVVWRDQVIPLIRLSEFFLLGDSHQEGFLIIGGVKGRMMAIMVEAVIGEQEIVIKSLGDFLGKDKLFGEIPGISGATIKGNGEVALILDIQGILKSFKKGGEAIER